MTDRDARAEGNGQRLAWSSSPRGRWELAAAAVFCLANVALPVWFVELYPFTAGTMYRDPIRQACLYEVRDPAGRELPAKDFHLQRNYNANPPDLGAGFKERRGLPIDQVPDEDAVAAWVRDDLGALPALEFIDVTQTVLRPESGGGIATLRRVLRVRNPAFHADGATTR